MSTLLLLELMEGVEPTYLRYKGNVITIIRHQRYVEHLEGFEPPYTTLCRRVPKTTRPQVLMLLDWRVTIPLPRRYQLRALTI